MKEKIDSLKIKKERYFALLQVMLMFREKL